MNKNYKVRDEIIFGVCDETKYFGGIRDFADMNPEVLNRLVQDDYADPDECQNNSPSIETFLNFSRVYPGVRFEGYAVSPKREDYRVTITAVTMTVKSSDGLKIAEFSRLFHDADEFEVEPINGYTHLRAWWD